MREAISREGARVTDGGPYDRWDLEVPGGALARARLLIAVEDQLRRVFRRRIKEVAAVHRFVKAAIAGHSFGIERRRKQIATRGGPAWTVLEEVIVNRFACQTRLGRKRTNVRQFA